MGVSIKIENLSKQYRLGLVGVSTFKEDTQRFWARLRGKEDPFKILGTLNDRTIKDNSKYVWSLKDINFDIQQGDVLGVIGRNGAGKSTLLKILSKVTAPTTGTVKVRGRIASLLEVGTGFHPELTGRENIYLNGAILGMRKFEIKSKLDEIVTFAGVEKYLDTPVKRYSSGMYVRLAFAVAAHLESEILIVDEVLAVGDAEFQKKCLGKMSELSHGEGRTVLFVSHNMAAIKQLCNSAILLENGLVKYSGDVSQTLGMYLHKKSSHIESAKLIKNRSGNQFAIFKEVKILNDNQNEIDTVLTGEDYTIKLIIECKSNLNNVNIGLSFHDKYDEIVTYIYSGFQNKLFNLTKGDNVISFKMKDFQINTDLLIVKGRITINDIESDWPKQNLLELNIQQGDFYRTGKTVELNSPLLIKGLWGLN
jgi:lipopolysaccharide transport system ATP-binding protein